MRTGWAVLGYFLGLVGGYLAILFGWIPYVDAPGFFDREGAGAMAVAFTIAPFGAVLAGIAGAILLGRARRGGPGTGTASGG
jgi:hypothetical protein